MWYVGQKVVCIDDTHWDTRKGEKTPKINQIYTIREIVDDPYSPKPFQVAFRFEEIVNKLEEYLGGRTEKAFRERRFKPLEENKTDISIFTEMLNKTPTEGCENLKKLQEKKKELVE